MKKIFKMFNIKAEEMTSANGEKFYKTSDPQVVITHRDNVGNITDYTNIRLPLNSYAKEDKNGKYYHQFNFKDGKFDIIKTIAILQHIADNYPNASIQVKGAYDAEEFNQQAPAQEQAGGEA